MKKTVIIFILALVTNSIFGSPVAENPSENISKAHPLESGHLETINNAALNTLLQENFVVYFDEVAYVNAEFSENLGYYYMVFGVKDNKPVTINLKIEKKDIENQTYTYLDFSQISSKENIEFCYYSSMCPPCSPNPRCETTVICGIWDGFNCSF